MENPSMIQSKQAQGATYLPLMIQINEFVAGM